jgi:hypothetical protein
MTEYPYLGQMFDGEGNRMAPVELFESRQLAKQALGLRFRRGGKYAPPMIEAGQERPLTAPVAAQDSRLVLYYRPAPGAPVPWDAPAVSIRLGERGGPILTVL